MENLLKNISQYRLFNYLLAGAVLAVALSRTTNIDLATDDAVTTFFVYYFVGMVISRVGSILVEPTLKFLRIIKFEPYPDYVQASSVDAKLDTLSQENNTYRTLIATFLTFTVIYLLDRHSQWLLNGKDEVVILSGAVLLMVLFAFAYRKQTEYITKRIRKTLANKG